MENNDISQKDLVEAMKRIEASNEKLEAYARKQCLMAQFTALCSLVIAAAFLALCIIYVPKANSMMTKLHTVMDNMTAITTQINDAKLGEMIDSIDRLADSSSDSLKLAAEKINSIDVNTLNAAIHQLSDVVAPLAEMMGR